MAARRSMAILKLRLPTCAASARNKYDDGTDGVLIYIKASLSQKEPRDILNYSEDVPSFRKK
jgi:hypothetical protein